MAAIAEIRVNLEDPYMIFGEANKADLVELVDVMKQRETKVAKEAASEQKHMVEECLRGSALSVLLQARAEEIQVSADFVIVILCKVQVNVTKFYPLANQITGNLNLNQLHVQYPP